MNLNDLNYQRLLFWFNWTCLHLRWQKELMITQQFMLWVIKHFSKICFNALKLLREGATLFDVQSTDKFLMLVEVKLKET